MTIDKDCDQNGVPQESPFGIEYWTIKEGTHHLRHRLDGPAVVYPDGSQEWWEYGNPHREGAPAVIDSLGNKEWWKEGVRHNLTGPAIILADGHCEWWVDGEKYFGDKLSLLIQAMATRTSPHLLEKLSQNKSYDISAAAVLNPNCPLEAKVEWALLRSPGEVALK